MVNIINLSHIFCHRNDNVLQYFLSKELERTTIIYDDKYKSMQAMDVFSQAIQYLKNHLLECVHKSGIEIKDSEVHWVLTVPAIWSDNAKRFMREAAINVI